MTKIPIHQFRSSSCSNIQNLIKMSETKSTPHSIPHSTDFTYPTKYILVTGGVISGLGKGISSSSVAFLLKKCGFRVTCIKIDPYLNVDAGTMSPYEHGEVFVLDDGGEVDLDLGTYERFLDIRLTRNHNITTGKIYQQVLEQERRGDFLGKTVQVVPHITDSIQEWIRKVSHVVVDKSGLRPQICMIELGGTVGDIEGMVFLEALRQFRVNMKPENFCHIHVSLIPTINEQKSKPTQHSFRQLSSVGLVPDLIFCRCEDVVDVKIREKISMFCMVPQTHVISMHNVSDTYQVPHLLKNQNVHTLILDRLCLPKDSDKAQSVFPLLRTEVQPNCLCTNKGEMHRNTIVELPSEKLHFTSKTTLVIVGKYTQLKDAYLSLTKALQHAAHWWDVELGIRWLESDEIDVSKDLDGVNGILIPGGFGQRGSSGKLEAIRYAREHKVPFLGICLGFQLGVIEYATNVKKMKVNSQEFEEVGDHAIVFMPETSTTHMGGTMRLGSHIILVNPGTRLASFYGGETTIRERHRHRYEVNPVMKSQLQDEDFIFTASDSTGKRTECFELKSHPFFIGTQFHPEFQSWLDKPAPVFREFLRAMIKSESN